MFIKSFYLFVIIIIIIKTKRFVLVHWRRKNKKKKILKVLKKEKVSDGKLILKEGKYIQKIFQSNGFNNKNLGGREGEGKRKENVFYCILRRGKGKQSFC